MLSELYFTASSQNPLLDTSKASEKPVVINSFDFVEPHSIDRDCLDALVNEIGALRVRAWRAAGMNSEDHFKSGLWIDRKGDYEQRTTHFVVYADGQKIIASARLRLFNSFQEIFSEDDLNLIGNKGDFLLPKIAKLERLVVDPEYQRLGFASALIQARLRYAVKVLGAVSVVTDADSKLCDLFQSIGFSELAVTESFEQCGEIKFPSHIFGALATSVKDI